MPKNIRYIEESTSMRQSNTLESSLPRLSSLIDRVKNYFGNSGSSGSSWKKSSRKIIGINTVRDSEASDDDLENFVSNFQN